MRDPLTFAFLGRSWRTLAASQTDTALTWITDGFADGDPFCRTGFSAVTTGGSMTCLVRLHPGASGAFDSCRPVHPFDLIGSGMPGTSLSIDPRVMLPYPAAPLGFDRSATSPVDVLAELSLIDGGIWLQALLSDAVARLDATAGNRARNCERHLLPLRSADCTAAARSSVSVSDLPAGAVVCLSGSFL